MASPIDGMAGVIIEGVVVGDFQGTSELRGFFLFFLLAGLFFLVAFVLGERF